MHESIGISPAQLLLGNAVTLDTEMFVPHSQRSSAVPLSEWAAERLKQQELLLSRAKLTQQKQDKANLTRRMEKRKLQAEPKPQSNPNDFPTQPKPCQTEKMTGNYIFWDLISGNYIFWDVMSGNYIF